MINREVVYLIRLLSKDTAEDISLGTAISNSLADREIVKGFAVGSMFIQQMQWMDGFWWPATIFLTNVPGSMSLTTEPVSKNFDITKNLAFQGTPVLDFTASDAGMSLYTSKPLGAP